MHDDASPQNRFQIPCERDIRKERLGQKAFASNLRKISFKGDGSAVTFATNLPFRPPRL